MEDRGRMNHMTATSEPSDDILLYISSLSPEKVHRLFSHLPQLTALLEESYQPYPQEPCLQTG